MTPLGEVLVLSHFVAMTAFAFFVSLVFAFLSETDRKRQVKYFLRTFGLFLLAVIGSGWLMYPFP